MKIVALVFGCVVLVAAEPPVPSSNYLPSTQYLPSSRSSHSSFSSSALSSRYSAPSQSIAPSSQYGAPTQYNSPSTQYLPVQYNNPSTQYGAPSSQYGAPGYARAGYDDKAEPANYNFQYDVQEHDNDFGHAESRQGDAAQGKYYVMLPDGRKQIVEYTADEQGFKPKVSYEQTSNGYAARRPNGYSNGGYSNGGYSNGAYSNGDYLRGGYSNNGGYSSGGYSNGGHYQNNGGYQY